ncbi:MAG: DUF3307 domain-containing protein [Oscillospiraceae bacterium]|nr:DUF3307 domain-containing protein [Oscillospiraceae bacterium]
MFKNIFLVLLFAHILGDFYLQTETLAHRKNLWFRYVLLHSGIYAAVCLLVIVPVFSVPMLLGAMAAALSHAMIDSVKYIFLRRGTGRTGESAVYVADQLTHIALLGATAFFVTRAGESVRVISFFRPLFDVTGISASVVFSWAMILLTSWKPANVTVKRLLEAYRPSDRLVQAEIAKSGGKDERKDAREESPDRMPGINSDEKKAGALIGLFERIIISVFLSIGQYSAIGLVLTAKSIARYDKISKSQAFAEYYLLGTLLSTAFAVVTYLLLA